MINLTESDYSDLNRRQQIRRIKRAKKIFSECFLCPRACRVNRVAGERGFCRAGINLEVAHWQLHFGEEPPLSEQGGAGAIFFAHCNLKCIYCQNYQISQNPTLYETMSPEQLCAIMLELQRQGAQNIDLVSAAHFVPLIIEAIYLAKDKGLYLPIVYNTNGYENLKTIELLSSIVDIYLPDFKYGDEKIAKRYSCVSDYRSFTAGAIMVMHDQVGDLIIDETGRAKKGLLVRHLVLPNRLAGSFYILDYLKRSVGVNIGLSLMSQYAPSYQAQDYLELNRSLTVAEYKEVVDYAEALGFEKCWIQRPESNSIYFPDFANPVVFKNCR